MAVLRSSLDRTRAKEEIGEKEERETERQEERRGEEETRGQDEGTRRGDTFEDG
jgi:hypothetical protein